MRIRKGDGDLVIEIEKISIKSNDYDDVVTDLEIVITKSLREVIKRSDCIESYLVRDFDDKIENTSGNHWTVDYVRIDIKCNNLYDADEINQQIEQILDDFYPRLEDEFMKIDADFRDINYW